MNARELEKLLRAAFSPDHVLVEDESQRHAGHKESTGGGHYIAVVVSKVFQGKAMVERHRMVYAAAHMPTPAIHALAVTAVTPEEWVRRGGK